jgi:GNAT superfamily N-acetyltransferase
LAALTIAYLADHPEAIPVLADWFAREWGQGSPAMESAAIGQRLAAQASRDELPVTLLGLLDGEPVATATLKFRELDYSPEADYWLGSVYVREDMRGRGFGRAIIAAAEAAAAEIGWVPLYLYSPSKASLYRRLGWESVGETTANAKRATVLRQACLTSTSSRPARRL